MGQRLSGGHTLIEILLVLALLAVLSVVALPAYRQALQKGHRVVAAALLMNIWAKQEAHRLQEGAYAADLASLGLAERRFLGPHGLQALPGQARYRLKLLMEGERYEGFELEVLGPQGSDPCGSLRVDVQGIVTAQGRSNAGSSCL